MLFVSKSNEGLQLCVNYCELNAITQKNQYSLSLINKIINCVCSTQIFTKIDV